MRSALLVLAALLVAGLPEPALAGADGPDRLEGDTLWSGRVVVTRDVVVANGSVLSIVGADVSFGNVSLVVEEGGRLVVTNDGARRARLGALPDAAWTALVSGEAEIVGAPNESVRVEGLGGIASLAGSGAAVTTLFNGGFTVRGAILARHVAFGEYASGVLVGQGARATFEDVVFASARGLGLFVTGTRVDVDGAIFSGAGANLGFTSGVPAASRNATPSLLRSILFSGVGRGVTVRDADVHLENVRFETAPLCLGVTYSARVTARHFSCSNFTIAAVLATASGDRRPEVSIDGFAVTSAWSVEAAVKADVAEALRLANGTLGPLRGHGVLASKVVPAMVNVTHEGIGRVNVVLANPPAIVRTLGEGGDSGAEGRLLVQAAGLAHVVDRDGHPVEGATVSFHYRSNGTLARLATTRADGYALAGTMEALRLGPDDALFDGRYLARLEAPDGTVIEREMHPNGRAVPFVIGSGAHEIRSVAAAGAIPLLAAVLLLALGVRRARGFAHHS